MRIYLSGAISDDPEHEYKFNAAEFMFKEKGYEVVNPVTLGEQLLANTDSVLFYNDYMIDDINQLFRCDAIYMLKGWEHSKGARAEHAIAVCMNKKIIYQR